MEGNCRPNSQPFTCSARARRVLSPGYPFALVPHHLASAPPEELNPGARFFSASSALIKLARRLTNRSVERTCQSQTW
jgi:hypothetical protein